MLEATVDIGKEFDGFGWHITIDKTRLGPRLTKSEACCVIAWLQAGTLQQWVDIYSNIVERAFAEKENNNG